MQRLRYYCCSTLALVDLGSYMDVAQDDPINEGEGALGAGDRGFWELRPSPLFLRSGSQSTLHLSIQSLLQVISRIADDRSLTVLRNGSLSFRSDQCRYSSVR